jgi:hypothetical protein
MYDTETGFESGIDEFESEEQEFNGFELTEESPLDEAEEMELAAQLLEITDEQELDQFLGGVFKKVWKGVKKIGKPLGGVLKKVAKVALPLAGKAAGTFFGGPLGGAIGGKIGSGAAKLFGLELEGMSPEDQEFEVARRFVRFAAAAAKQAASVPPDVDQEAAARSIVKRTARRHAPGLLAPRPRRRKRWPRPVYAGPSFSSTIQAAPEDEPETTEGRWVRRGKQIIVVNCAPPS